MKKLFQYITALFFFVCCFVVLSFSNDSLASTQNTPLLTPAPDVSPPNPSPAQIPDRYSSFRVQQKKHLRTVIITNLLYGCGFGLYRGVVLPRYRKATDFSEQMSVLPLSLLSNTMIYVSLPMSVVASRKAKRNYEHYYKEAPRNFTMPLLFVGVGCLLGATAIDYYQLIKDYQDNNELDNTYIKYDNIVFGIVDAGTICWAGTNLYALIYTIVLHKKAQKNSKISSLQITPFRCMHANGLTISCEY